MVNVKKSNSFFFAACLGVLLPCTNVFSQGVTVETRSAAESQTNVRVQGGGQGVDVESKTRAESSTRTRVRGGGAAIVAAAHLHDGALPSAGHPDLVR